MIRTFLDAGVLIKGVRSPAAIAINIIEIMDDPERKFFSTSLLELEVLPKAIHHKKVMEAAFYREYFETKAKQVQVDEALIQRALKRSIRLGLSALDGLHLEAAITARADEFITTEKPTKPLFREVSLKITSI